MPANLSSDVIDALTKRTQDGGTEVVQAKAGKVRARGVEYSDLSSNSTKSRGYGEQVSRTGAWVHCDI